MACEGIRESKFEQLTFSGHKRNFTFDVSFIYYISKPQSFEFQLMLNDVDCEEIYVKWIEHLLSTKNMVCEFCINKTMLNFNNNILRLCHVMDSYNCLFHILFQLQAIFVMLSIGKFDQALRTLDYIGYTETAVCFIKVCQESGVKLPKG